MLRWRNWSLRYEVCTKQGLKVISCIGPLMAAYQFVLLTKHGIILSSFVIAFVHCQWVPQCIFSFSYCLPEMQDKISKLPLLSCLRYSLEYVVPPPLLSREVYGSMW